MLDMPRTYYTKRFAVDMISIKAESGAKIVVRAHDGSLWWTWMEGVVPKWFPLPPLPDRDPPKDETV
jgi:hypothetical protein